jgi:hypothetical protein
MFRPFYELQSTASIRQLLEVIGGVASNNTNNPNVVKDLEAQIRKWRSDPFDPHGIAAMRPLAYMLWIFSSYVEILIEWGDALFTQDTRESINEAIQLYMIAAQMLGRKPDLVERPDSKPMTFAELLASGLDAFSNAAVAVESALPIGQVFDDGLPDVALTSPIPTGDGRPGRPSLSPIGRGERPPRPRPSPLGRSLYFCIPENPQLLGLWDTIADRLFKFRHCMNIKGEVRELALFQPPIDPGLLVRARAAGLDLAEVIAGLNAPPPHYRFTYMLQKANEFAAEVKSFGGALLSALEKRDSEAMAQLRSQQEISLQKATRNVRSRQLEEAKQQLASTLETRKVTETRLQNYQSRQYRIKEEQDAIKHRETAETWMWVQKGAEMLGAGLIFIPDLYASAPPIVKTGGGDKIGKAAQLTGMAAAGVAEAFRNKSIEAADNASVKRRWEEWQDQIKRAQAELKQIDKQIVAAEIRVAIAEQEQANLDLQIEHAKETLEFMKSKFSNEDLYEWMGSQLLRLHREAYQLARNLAKQAQRAFEYEIGTPDHPIGAAHWEPGRKGLLAGEMLGQDLRYLDSEYMVRNERTYELKRDVSLRLLEPQALMTLIQSSDKSCEFDVPEWLFQLDAPGHYKRRIKSIAVSIPCVVGPYTPLHCKLTLLSHEIREEAIASTVPDRRYDAMQSIVTSSGLNDAGLFEANLQDPRYLPFEGRGAIARFRLTILSDVQFDSTTVSDAVLHIRYTAQEGGDTFRSDEKQASAANADLPELLLSMRYDFPDEWNELTGATGTSVTVTFPSVPKERLPYRARAGYDAATDYRAPKSVWALRLLATGQYELVEVAPITGLSLDFDGNRELTYASDPNPIKDLILRYEKA